MVMFRLFARMFSIAAVVSSLVVLGLGGAASADPINILTPGDPIVGIWQTTAENSSTTSTVGTTQAGQYPAAEPPSAAIDGSVDTKYLNFGTGGGSGVTSPTKGEGTGFYVTPLGATGGLATLVTGIRFATANDAPERDPLTITLEGSNATGADLALGVNWTLIYSGSTGLEPLFSNTPEHRKQYGDVQSFANSEYFTSYRVLVTSHRGVANSVQYSEVELLGQVIPEPSTAVLAALGLLGVALFARRRRAR
jgi:hypothetical protein